MLLSLLISLISIYTTTTADVRSSNLTIYNQLINRTSNLYIRKKSNSIELLKKRLANRHHSSKINRILSSTSTTTKSTTILSSITHELNTTSQFSSTTTTINNDEITTNNIRDDLSSSASLLYTIATNKSSNSTLVAIIFIFCLCGFILLTFIFTYLIKEHFTGTYLKLPCIHSLSSKKQSRDSTPLFYSPIHSKYQKD
ncbi:hypothetical protein I4U23_001729 [Adineta vaga]|nr:hypothetical protein I4U23_001729 [Adineta vaga]